MDLYTHVLVKHALVAVKNQQVQCCIMQIAPDVRFSQAVMIQSLQWWMTQFIITITTSFSRTAHAV